MNKRTLSRINLSLLLGVSLTGVSLFGNATGTTSAEALQAAEIEQVLIEDKVTTVCPNAFYQVKLPENGKLCQVFAADLPASMIFFVPQSPSEVVNYYEVDGTIFESPERVKDRYMLQSTDKNTTLIISSDGTGTQVDVLVKSEQS